LSETIALVGSETLLGRELRDLLAQGSFGADVRLVAGADEASGVLAEHAGEAAILNKLDILAMTDVVTVILAGNSDSSRLALELAPDKPVIDLTHTAEENPRSRLRAPMVEPAGFRVAADAIHSIAHPAAIALAVLFQRVALKHKLVRWIVHVFEPTSERGTAGIEELQQQTVSLLSFKPMPKKVFDTQLSFNMLAAFGEDAAVQLEEVETRIERHLATLMQNVGQSPMPSLKLIQAPIFHGYSFSIWMEFSGDAPDRNGLEALLQGENVSVHDMELEPPNNAGVAGQDGVAIGAISRDRNNSHAIWLWMAADNLRLAGQNAMLVAQEIL
jgi:aspartate-semialdehyde dehydrogenase